MGNTEAKLFLFFSFNRVSIKTSSENSRDAVLCIERLNRQFTFGRIGIWDKISYTKFKNCLNLGTSEGTVDSSFLNIVCCLEVWAGAKEYLRAKED